MSTKKRSNKADLSVVEQQTKKKVKKVEEKEVQEDAT